MKKLLLWLILTGIGPLLTTGQTRYNHKIIAVLPVRTMFVDYNMLADSSMQGFQRTELTYGLQLQQALYNTIVSDTNRLLVVVQPWEVTDSILKQAGVDLRKIPYMDIDAVAKILKVDACIVTTVRRKSRKGSNVGPTTGAALGVTPVAAAAIGIAGAAAAQEGSRMIKSDSKLFSYELVDGKSGNTIWSSSDVITFKDLTLYKDGLVCSPNIFARFKKRFPYCD